MLALGTQAPDFELQDQNGQWVRLSEFQNQALVLFFYPKDFTPGCTAEACAFRDAFEDFTELGATVIGISQDSHEQHASFAARYRLPYVLLSDPSGLTAKAYQIGKTLGFIPGRITYVLDRQHKIVHSFSSQLNIQKHIQSSIAILKKLI